MKDCVRIGNLGLHFGPIHIVGLDLDIYWYLFNRLSTQEFYPPGNAESEKVVNPGPLRRALEDIVACIPPAPQKVDHVYKRECQYPGIGRVSIVSEGGEYHLVRRDKHEVG